MQDGGIELMDTVKIPKHIAIMMDGNGRWAKRKFMARFGKSNL